MNLNMKNRISQNCLYACAIAAFVASTIISPVAAQTDFESSKAEREHICSEAAAKPWSEPSFTKPMSEAQLKNCDSAALYYGFDKPPDFEAALQCAFYQRSHPDPTVGDPFAGPGTLSMLYANGKGVKRDYNLAIRFACENTWAGEFELNHRIGRLKHLQDTDAATSRYDLCDDGISGLIQGACADVDYRLTDAKRQKQLAGIKSQWPTVVQKAFKSVEKAEDDFEKARTSNEVDLSGTGHYAFTLAELDRLRNQFLIDLNRFAKGDIPAASAADAAAIDRRLNAVYRQVENAPENSWYGTIKPAGIRSTQRTWLKLRDAWVEFARLAYPNLDATEYWRNLRGCESINCSHSCLKTSRRPTAEGGGVTRSS